MSLIILEGVDGTGKTTLARKLYDQYGYRILKRNAPNGHPLVEYTASIEAANGANVVCDRWHLGEAVYSVTRRDGQTKMTGAIFEAIEEYLLDKGALLVLCVADQYANDCVLEARGEVHPKIEEERALFELETSRSALPLMTVTLGMSDVAVHAAHASAQRLEYDLCN